MLQVVIPRLNSEDVGLEFARDTAVDGRYYAKEGGAAAIILYVHEPRASKKDPNNKL